MTRRRQALVTGASSGIGRGIAEQLAHAGYDLTISARRIEQLEVAATELRSYGGQVRVVPADMARDDDVQELARQQLALGDCLDVLVLAAGTGTAGSLDSYPVRRLDSQLAVNVRGPFVLVQRLLPALRAAAAISGIAGARIVAIASITGVAAEPDLAAYGASKAALISLCESITVSEAAHGVSATSISPGYVDTDMTAWVRDRIPPDQMIRVEDVATLVVALCAMSRFAAVPNIVMTRPGPLLWRA